MINSNPVFDSKYNWKDVEVVFDDDFKEIKIKQGNNEIVVQGSFFTDVGLVMEQIIKEEGQLFRLQPSPKFWYSLRTSLSCPTAEW